MLIIIMISTMALSNILLVYNLMTAQNERIEKVYNLMTAQNERIEKLSDDIRYLYNRADITKNMVNACFSEIVIFSKDMDKVEIILQRLKKEVTKNDARKSNLR